MSESKLLELEIIQKIDKDNMLKAVEDFPEQIEEAAAIARTATLRGIRPNTAAVLIAGMGGSGIGGDIVEVLLRDEADILIHANKGYILPNFADETSLCFVVSYSGQTEEALSCYEQAVNRGVPVIAITSGGELARRAQDQNIPIVAIPAGLQPRAALGYLAVPLLVCLERLKIIESKEKELHECVRVLKKHRQNWWRHAPLEKNTAQLWALKLAGQIPIVYGSEGVSEVAALRWKCQFNETSKTPAFWNKLPELCHNEIAGWERFKETTKKFSLILLREETESDRQRKRVEITRQLIEKQFGQVHEAWADGDSRVAKLFSLIYFGDFVATYLAILNGVDPSLTEKIDILKRKLAANPDKRR